MKTLKEYLTQATQEGWAIGHFNFATVEQLMGIVAAAKKTRAPVMVGTSEGERDLLHPTVASAMVRALREELQVPIFLNADHSKRVDRIVEALGAGYDSVHIDASELPYEENVTATKNSVEEVKKHSEIVSIEGELGFVRGASELYKEAIAVTPEDYTKAEQAREFLERTGVDRLAIMVGNIHGISPDEPKLDIDRIREIRELVPKDVILVLHAASGISDQDVKEAIQAGIANVHVSTEIRVVWKQSLIDALADAKEEYAPYKILPQVVEDIERLVTEKIGLFGSFQKA